jgi:RNA polymerase sigma-70 factor (ECF subfamily)
MTLEETFLDALGTRAAALADTRSDLHSLLLAHVSAGRSAWPEVVLLTPEEFARQLAAVVAMSDDPADALRTIVAKDFYLARACGVGDQNAIRTFEARLINPIVSRLHRPGPAGDAHSELRQLLLTRLFVSEPGSPARIHGYRGRGPLWGWLRTVASRAVVDLRRQMLDRHLDPADLGQMFIGSPDPEREYLACLDRSELGGALVATMGMLPEREKSFLRLHYLDEMSMDGIASLFQVSRRTVHRAIARSRAEILQKTRAALVKRLKLSQAELETVMELSCNQLNVNFHELLAAQ